MKLVPMPLPAQKQKDMQKLLLDALQHNSFNKVLKIIEKHNKKLAKVNSPFHKRIYNIFTTVFTKSERHTILKDYLKCLYTFKPKPQDIAIAGSQGWEEELGMAFLLGVFLGFVIYMILDLAGGKSEDKSTPPNNPDDYGDNTGDFPTPNGDSAAV